ncbi:hypothetical protein AVEN_72174-1, partial [Araneus ventricosus]
TNSSFLDTCRSIAPSSKGGVFEDNLSGVVPPESWTEVIIPRGPATKHVPVNPIISLGCPIGKGKITYGCPTQGPSVG